MFRMRPHDRQSNTSRFWRIAAGSVAVSALLFGTVAGTADAAAASPATSPTISSVSFGGTAGSGKASPTITIDGSGFGSEPLGVPDNVTSCGTYTDNGDVYENELSFLDVSNFRAGYSDNSGASCIGIKVQSWSNNQVVLQFGNAYGTFQHWYLSNGDSYDVYIWGYGWGGLVSGLS